MWLLVPRNNLKVCQLRPVINIVKLRGNLYGFIHLFDKSTEIYIDFLETSGNRITPKIMEISRRINTFPTPKNQQSLAVYLIFNLSISQIN